MNNYVVAASKDWFERHPKSTEYKDLSIYYIDNKEELSHPILSQIKPRYIFFPHWNWKVNKSIYESYECIAFHVAPLPYGRGGSPIQNLIIRGFKKAPLCSLKMNETIDGGPIYQKEDISLKGNIDQIYSRIAISIEQMIINICRNNPSPVIQDGDPLYFKRLTYKDNELDCSLSLAEIYDRIRMVDGKDYRSCYLYFGEYKIEFKEADIRNEKISAKVIISKDRNNENYEKK